MDKKTARQLVRAQKKQMTSDEIQAKSQLIFDKVVKAPWFTKAHTIYCYVSYNQEVMTQPFIARALQEGKTVAVPKVLGKEMEFFYLHSLSELAEGFQGIPEPTGGDLADPVAAREEGKELLMILPGLAFDRQCNRVGYGGGFYDRYLAKYQKAEFTKIAVAFDFQVVEKLEMESCDLGVDTIVTEKRIIEAEAEVGEHACRSILHTVRSSSD